MRYTKEEVAEALTALRGVLKPGDTVYTVVVHVTRSRMRRSIEVLICRDGQPWPFGWLAARVLAWPYDRDRGGVVVRGTGMDMGFHLVYALAERLFPGYESPTLGQTTTKGGYALNHRWL